jgi:hypothetical protein
MDDHGAFGAVLDGKPLVFAVIAQRVVGQVRTHPHHFLWWEK